ncbi:MAG: T9SS type A sorting domain-containing protein [Bacteroidia bacterium]|nr:T9SS type A sorting domain-containing protein [Bacteroidota bacterium]MBP9083424.1 T9SS type A sorting domain-containing protein [Bacteroidia bacterium]
MKKLLLVMLTVGFFLTGKISAQTTLTQAVDFTVTDVNGDVHNLFDILNAGQYVCMDFFFTTCPPCIATSPYYRDTYENFGCNTEDIFFIAMDVGDTDAEVIAYENSVLGGSPGYPSVSGIDGGGNAVVTAYGVGAFPTYILIAPNKNIVETDMWPIANATTFATFFGTHGLSPVPCSTVGIGEQNAISGFSIFPNPATGKVSVSADTELESVRIFDVAGKLWMDLNTSNKNFGKATAFDIAELPAGVYLVEVISEGASVKSRLVKM